LESKDFFDLRQGGFAVIYTHQSTIISIRSAIFTADKTLSTTDLPPWQSDGDLQPEIRQYRSDFAL